MGFMAIITAMVSFARSKDSLRSVSVRIRKHVVFSTAGFNDGGKPCLGRAAALLKGIQKACEKRAISVDSDSTA